MYAQMLPVLQAREALQEVTILRVGTGHADKGGAARLMRDWTRLANVGATKPTLDPVTTPPEIIKARIEAMGFKVS